MLVVSQRENDDEKCNSQGQSLPATNRSKPMIDSIYLGKIHNESDLLSLCRDFNKGSVGVNEVEEWNYELLCAFSACDHIDFELVLAYYSESGWGLRRFDGLWGSNVYQVGHLFQDLRAFPLKSNEKEASECSNQQL